MKRYRVIWLGLLLVLCSFVVACERDVATVPAPDDRIDLTEPAEVAEEPTANDISTAPATATGPDSAATATSAPAQSPAPGPESTASSVPLADVATPYLSALLQLNVHGGPGIEYGLLGILPGGAQTSIAGRSEAADGLTWWQIACPPHIAADECWVSGEPQLVQAFNSDNVPEATAAPTHTPALSPIQQVTVTGAPQISVLEHQGVPPEGIAAQLGFLTGISPCFDALLAPGGVLELGNSQVLERVCVRLEDYTENEPVTVTISSPSGEFDRDEFTYPTSDHGTWRSDGTYYWFWRFMPNSPLGEFTILFTQQGHEPAIARLTLQQATVPRIQVLTPSGPAGTIFRFALAGLEPGEPLYLYRVSAECLCYEYLTELPPPQVNTRGEANYELPTEADDPPGMYVLYLPGVGLISPPKFEVTG